MRIESEHYLERLCDRWHASGTAPRDAQSEGIEPFALAAELRYSPKRTKAVLAELLAHHLLDLKVCMGSDGRNELRLLGNREAYRWYARMLRYRQARQQYRAG